MMRRMVRPIRLPVAVREHARVVRDVEIARLRLGQPREAPSPRPRVQRLPVTAGEERAGTADGENVMRMFQLIIPPWSGISTRRCCT